MKKVLSLLLVLILALSMLAGCSSETPANDNSSEETPTGDNDTDSTVIEKIGLGHITSIAKSKDLAVDNEGNEVLPAAQVDTVIAAAAFDKDGKVVKVSIDTAQTKINFNSDLSIASDLNADQKTKVELGDDYGLIKASSIQKEWYQQIAELEKWMVGKTVDEIKAMKVKERDASHPSVPDEPELTSLVTISVGDYIAAVEEAYNNAVEAKGAEKLGLATNISIAKSKGLSTDSDGNDILPLGQVDNIITATAFDKDGKVVRAIIDNAQTKVNFDKDGKVTSDRNEEYKTKVELGDDYGMIKASSIQKEWYQQMAELEKWMAGKTIDEIKAMKVKEKDASHPSVPDEAELTSLVTISVGDYIATVAKSFGNAK